MNDGIIVFIYIVFGALISVFVSSKSKCAPILSFIFILIWSLFYRYLQVILTLCVVAFLSFVYLPAVSKSYKEKK